MYIQMTWAELQHRTNYLQKMLRPLGRKNKGPALAWSKRLWQESILGAHDGFSRSQVSSEYRKWRFGTPVQGVRCAYFERWLSSNTKQVYLDRAYLNIYRFNIISGDEHELICLHCDPNIQSSDEHYKYKRGPHIHVKEAEEPFPGAHLALNLGNIDSVLSSVDNFSKAMDEAILMIKDQVLDSL